MTENPETPLVESGVPEAELPSGAGPLVRSLKRRRKSKTFDGQPPGPGEEWMLTYMDTVTLLVTLFVMLLSFSSFDDAKYEAFAKALTITDYGAGVLTGTPLPIEVPDADFSSDEPELADMSRSDELVDQFRDSILGSGLSDKINLKKIEAGVQLEISDNVLFPVASAELTVEGHIVVTNLAGILGQSGIEISVEGHTDNIPIRNDVFNSNWELSGARASAVVHRLIENGVNAEALRIVGYADTRPKADNSTDEGRAKNRRVNIVVNLSDEKNGKN